MVSRIQKLQFADNTLILRSMGNTQQPEQELNFIQTASQHPFGPIEIYQAKSGLFIMKKVQTQAYNHINIKSVSKVQRFALQYHQNIIPIVKVIEHQEFGMCGKVLVSEVYTEYYNFTLKDLMLSKKNLEEAQLLYILKSLLHLCLSLQENLFFANFSLQSIFVTLSGSICLSHYQIQSSQFSQLQGDYDMLPMIAKLMIHLISSTFIEDYCKVTQFQQIKTELAKISQKYQYLSKIIAFLLSQQAIINDILDYIERLANNKLIHIATEIKLAKFKIQLPASQIQQIASHHSLSQIFNHSHSQKEEKPQMKKSQDEDPRMDKVKEKNNQGVKININLMNDVVQSKQKALFTVKKKSNHTQSTAKRPCLNQKVMADTNVKHKQSNKISSTEKKVQSSQKKEKSFRKMQMVPKTFVTEYSNSKQAHLDRTPFQQSQQPKTTSFEPTISLSKGEKTKMFCQLQRRKQQFEGQKQRFKQKKQQLLQSCVKGQQSDLKAMVISKIESLKTEQRKDEKLSSYGYKKNRNEYSNKCHYR